MTNEPRAMKEIHDIRERIYEEIKDLDEKAQTEYFRNAAKEVEKKHGIKFRRPGDPPMGKVV